MGAVTIQEVRDEARFEELRGAWSALHLRSEVSNIYLAPEFIHTWWKHLGALDPGSFGATGGLGQGSRGEGLRILVGTDGDQMVGVAPLQMLRVELEGFPEPLRVLALVGDVFLTRYRDVLAAPDRQRDFLDALWAHLSQGDDPGWDVVLLGNLPEESPTRRLSTAALQRHKVRNASFRSKVAGSASPEDLREVTADRLATASERTARLLRDRLVDMEYPYVALPPTWEEYKAALSYRTRRTLQGDANKLARAGTITYECVGSEFDPVADFDDLVRLHRGILGESSVTLNPRTLEMQRELLAGCAARGWLRLFFLKVNAKRIAALACYDYRDRRYAALLGRDREAPASPGILIITHAIEDAITRGLRELDFGPGHVRYKQHLSRATRRVSNLLVKRDVVPLSLHDLAMKLHGFAA